MPKRPLFAFLLTAFLLFALPVTAQDDGPEPGWYDTAELTYVTTSGNAEADTLGLKNSLQRIWDDAVFSLDAGALRVETTTIARFAQLSGDGVSVGEIKTSELTAENYYLRGRYDRNITDRFFWYAGAGWERNEFAGFTDRLTAVAGVGNIWWQEDRGHFRTDYGLTYTQQDDVVINPDFDDSFLGLRLSYDYLNKLTDTTEFTSVLIVDQNLDETDDLRADFINAVAVSMTERLALKASLQLLYDNMPALVAVDVVNAAGELTGDSVLAELEDLDSLFTLALVVNF
ncbi:MAG: DUF481 domain-containing protein [Acidobacteriota bacterium]